MVFISDMWNELWSKSRKMIVNRSFRQKRNRHEENNLINKKIPVIDNLEMSSTTIQQAAKYKRSNPDSETHLTTAFTRCNSKRSRHISFDNDDKIYLTVEPPKVDGGMKLVKCHIYEQLSPIKTATFITRGKCHYDSDSDDECPMQIKQEAQVHSPASDDDDRLIRDDNGVPLSPIAKSSPQSSRNSPIPKVSPLPKVEDSQCRRNLEGRFVVNAYRSGCWQRLSKRKQNHIDDTHILKVSELANTDKTNVNTDVEPKSIIAPNDLVGELYRARITPDKILAKSIKNRCRQQRVVPCSFLNMFDTTQESGDEFVKLLETEASKIELNDSEIMAEPIYATPNKSLKKPSENVTIPPNDIAPLDHEDEGLKLNGISSADSETFFKLKEEADTQCRIMRQASKALEMSRRSEPSYVDMRGQVEAEKILLTANCKYEKVLQEIRQNHYEKPIESKHLGTIEVSGITVGLSENFTEEQTGWFVLVMMDEKRIFCSTPVDVKVGDKKITFDRTFYFDNLDGTFEITGKMYCLLHRRVTTKKSEGRFASKLRLSSRKLRYMDLYTREFVENNVVSSSFVPSGYFKLTVNDLQKCESTEPAFKVTTYENSPLNTKLDLKVRLAQMKIDIEKCGMVNIRSMTDQTAWHRRWCTMTGTVLQFWNSPLDEAFNEPPLMLIDLVYCRKEIESANKAVCPRAKTLALVTSKGTYYINIDTIRELWDWKQPLNEVYRALCDWKMLKA